MLKKRKAAGHDQVTEEILKNIGNEKLNIFKKTV